jgi:uncharacterized protein YjbJ (UPF0337 family)
MDWDRVKTNWKVHCESARQHWDLLSEDDLLRIGGEKDRLVVFLQDLYGMGMERAEVEAETWREGLTDSATLVIADSVPESEESANNR